jgi:hypothetical protein
MNRKIVLLLICSLSMVSVQAEISSFVYNQEEVVHQEEHVEKIIRNHFIKKAAFVTTTLGLIGAICYTNFKNAYINNNMITQSTFDGCIQKVVSEVPVRYSNPFLDESISCDYYVEMAQTVTQQAEKISWMKFIGNGAKMLSFEVLKSAFISQVLSQFQSINSTVAADVSLIWYVNNHTHFSSSLHALHAKSELLPLEEDSEEQLYKLEIIKNKVDMLLPHIYKAIAYMNYRKKITEKYDTMTAVRMEAIINHMIKKTKNFCESVAASFDSYKKDSENRMDKAVKLSTTVDIFKETLDADLRSFEEYELYE